MGEVGGKGGLHADDQQRMFDEPLELLGPASLDPGGEILLFDDVLGRRRGARHDRAQQRRGGRAAGEDVPACRCHHCVPPTYRPLS